MPVKIKEIIPPQLEAKMLDTKNVPQAKVLVVDDDRTMMMVLTAMLENKGYTVISATDGCEALEVIERRAAEIDVILLDRIMPNMGGMEVVAHLKDDPRYRHIPIIMETGSNRPEEIKEGIDAGVFYYLTKPLREDILNSVLTAALRDVEQRNLLHDEMHKQKSSFHIIKRATFEFRTLEEAESLACFLANCYPDPRHIIAGLAELLINAVEHGNLEIGYEMKTVLVTEGRWRHEVVRREELPKNKDKYVRVRYHKSKEFIQVDIKDFGSGFNWKEYLSVDPARAMDNHGRGIAQANMVCFDKLNFNDEGNEVTAIVKLEESLNW